MQRWDRLLDQYVERLAGRGLSPDHIKNVRRELERLGCWLKARRPKPALEQVDAELVIKYVRGRTTFRAKATLSGVLSILRGWGEFLVYQGIWTSNPLRWIQGPKIRSRVPLRIGKAAMERLWQSAAESRQGYSRYLWLAVLSLLYGTGLRRGELQRLNLTDFDLTERLLRMDGRKTGCQRTAAVPELTLQCLQAYLPQRANQLHKLGVNAPQAALLVDQFGGRLSSHAISLGIKRIARRSGLEDITLHQFRHTCASDLLEAGVRLPEVQRQLGHACITTTVRYLHVADPHRRTAADLHPINQILTQGVQS
jgi:site-specific recombinase XerD